MKKLFIGDIIQATDYIKGPGMVICPGTIGKVSYIDTLGTAIIKWGNGLISALNPQISAYSII